MLKCIWLHTKFVERESKLRQMANALNKSLDDEEIRKQRHDIFMSSGGDAKNDGNSVDNLTAEAKNSSESKTSENEQDNTVKGSAKGQPVKKEFKISRPAWALTESTAAVIAEEKLNDDEKELLNFAEGLDFEKYMGDIEIKTTMERLKRRIADLEREALQEDLREAELEGRRGGNSSGVSIMLSRLSGYLICLIINYVYRLLLRYLLQRGSFVTISFWFLDFVYCT